MKLGCVELLVSLTLHFRVVGVVPPSTWLVVTSKRNQKMVFQVRKNKSKPESTRGPKITVLGLLWGTSTRGPLTKYQVLEWSTRSFHDTPRGTRSCIRYGGIGTRYWYACPTPSYGYPGYLAFKQSTNWFSWGTPFWTSTSPNCTLNRSLANANQLEVTNTWEKTTNELGDDCIRDGKSSPERKT